MKTSPLACARSRGALSGSASTLASARGESRVFDVGPAATRSRATVHGAGQDVDGQTAIETATATPWPDEFVIEVRHTAAFWRVTENGASISAFADLEDAVPLALAYAQARGDAGHDATVFLKPIAAPRLCVARYGPAAIATTATVI